MVAVWRRAWRSKKVSSTGLGSGSSSGVSVVSLWMTSGNSTTTTSSGTTTTYTTVSSEPVSEPPLVVEESAGEGLDLESGMKFKQEVVETRRHLRGLVEEFCGGDGASGKVTAPERWLSELNVAWLLHLAELDASARGIFISQQHLEHIVQSWVQALQKVSTSIWKCFSGFPSQEEPTVAPPEAPEFVRFIEATFCKMLTFVGAIVTTSLNVDDPSCQEQIVSRLAGELRALHNVRDTLSSVPEQIMVSFRSSPYVQVQHTRITDDMGGLLSAELGKLDQAICDTLDRIRTTIMSSLKDNSSSSWATTQTLQPSPDIHKVTRSVINCIKVLFTKEFLPANYQVRKEISLTEMLTCLEEKLSRVSESFSDQSLRFLFLTNNTHFIWQQLHQYHLTQKIDRYIESYLQVSWAPMLMCLNNPKYICFMKSSPLPKFESKFQTTYAAQKLCKVPDPELRKFLRKAIIEKVVSGFTKYLEDNSRITPGVTPQRVEEMLQELFEG